MRQPGDILPHPTAGTLEKTKDGKPRVLPPEFKLRKSRLDAHELKAKHIEQYLSNLAASGRKYESAKVAGMSYQWLKKLRGDPDFVTYEEEAMEDYRDRVAAELHRRAVEGWDEPIIGGANRDIVVTTVRKYSDRLLELLAKRHMPEFREKYEGELKITGGVLVAPVAPKTPEDWARMHGGERKGLPSGQQDDIIDVPAESEVSEE